MPIKHDTTDVKAIYAGTSTVKAVYDGSRKIWPRPPVLDSLTVTPNADGQSFEVSVNVKSDVWSVGIQYTGPYSSWSHGATAYAEGRVTFTVWFSNPGTYTIQVKGIVSGETSNILSQSVTVRAKPPTKVTVKATASGDRGVNVAVTVTGDMLGELTYKYDWGDGSSDTLTEPGTWHTYSGYGPFTITVTVSNSGGSASDSTTISYTHPNAPVVSVTGSGGVSGGYFNASGSWTVSSGSTPITITGSVNMTINSVPYSESWTIGPNPAGPDHHGIADFRITAENSYGEDYSAQGPWSW